MKLPKVKPYPDLLSIHPSVLYQIEEYENSRKPSNAMENNCLQWYSFYPVNVQSKLYLRLFLAKLLTSSILSFTNKKSPALTKTGDSS